MPLITKYRIKPKPKRVVKKGVGKKRSGKKTKKKNAVKNSRYGSGRGRRFIKKW